VLARHSGCAKSERFILFGIAQKCDRASNNAIRMVITFVPNRCMNELCIAGGSVEALIERGVMRPTRELWYNIQCRSETCTADRSGSVYTVSVFGSRARFNFDSSAYRKYKCGRAINSKEFTWCRRLAKTRNRGHFKRTYSILHSRDGTAVSSNSYQSRLSSAQPSRRLHSTISRKSAPRHE